jgi:hypothetical protein
MFATVRPQMMLACWIVWYEASIGYNGHHCINQKFEGVAKPTKLSWDARERAPTVMDEARALSAKPRI